MDKVTPGDQDGNQDTRQQSPGIPRKMGCNGLKIEKGRGGKSETCLGDILSNKDQRRIMEQ